MVFKEGGMMKYEVWTKGKDLMGKVKTYPFKLQAYIWCWLNGYVNKVGSYGYSLDERVEIKECE